MNVNVWDVVEELKAIIARGHPLDPKRLADPAIPLGELA
jgi:3-phenylpropionate/trans-cinnamate dioxygenase ferredoxin reductase subunit